MMLFLTVKTADSRLENIDILNLDEKVRFDSRGSKGSPDHGKEPLAAVQAMKVTGRKQAHSGQPDI